MLEIQLLGDFHLAYGGKPIESVGTSRLQSLLAYLLLHWETPQPRHYLSFLFWPDSTEEQAHTNLRYVLFKLRQNLPDSELFLRIQTKTLQWRHDSPFVADVLAYRHALAQAQAAQLAGDRTAEQAALREAVILYQGDLLLSCYEEWILPERERLRQSFLETLERLIDLSEERRDYAGAIHFAQRLLEHDSLHEAAYRHLMRLYALNGERARALHVYHTCVSTLEREVGVEPAQLTQELYAQLLSSEVQSGAATPSIATATFLPLVGREKEWQQLQETAQVVLRSTPHFVLISGEAGIGKTRLAEELVLWANRHDMLTAQSCAYAAEGRLAYARVAGWLRSPAIRPRLDKLDVVWQMEVTRLLPELLAQPIHLPQPEPITESWQRLRLFEALARAVLAAESPLLLVLDDLQWCDHETLEWLHYLLRFDMQAHLLVVGTIRSEEVSLDQPLHLLQSSLRNAGQFTELSLTPLDKQATALLATQVVGHALAAGEEQRLYKDTEGYPLFIVETVRATHGDGYLETNLAVMANDGSTPGTIPQYLPPKVYNIIQRRLAQLSPSGYELAGLAAVVGREFTFNVLRLAGEQNDMALVQGLDELWQRRIIRERGAEAYDFSHDKIREVAYAEMSLLRRRLLHRRVATGLEQVCAANLDAVSGQIATHYEQGGLAEQAIVYYLRAGDVARRFYANWEATRLLRRGLELVPIVPDATRRMELEVDLQTALAPVLVTMKGYIGDEVIEAYTRALELCRQLQRRSQAVPVLWGLWARDMVQAHLEAAYSWASELADIAETESDPTHQLLAYYPLAMISAHRGDSLRALELVEQTAGLKSQATRSPQIPLPADPRVMNQWWISHSLWHLGYAHQARNQCEILLAVTLDHGDAFSRVAVLAYSAMTRQFLREPQMVLEQTEVALGIESDPYYRTWVAMLHGWARAELGEVEAGRQEIYQGFTEFTQLGAAIRRPYYLALIAAVERGAGNLAKGLATLDEALAHVGESGEHFYTAELHRLRGEFLLLHSGTVEEAEKAYRRALDIAHEQRAKTLELRAAVSLARLWSQQNKRGPAYQILTTTYNWFTEGFDTLDLQEARSLIQELSAKS